MRTTHLNFTSGSAKPYARSKLMFATEHQPIRGSFTFRGRYMKPVFNSGYNGIWSIGDIRDSYSYL
jgi:hypothetical protein